MNLGMSVGIVGGGVVGSAMARCFMEWATVKVYDVLGSRRSHGLSETLDSDLVFVCLPTPKREDSLECNLDYLEEFFKRHRGYRTNFVLRSTVPIGTTKRFSQEYELPNLVHSPEFLTARCSVTDAHLPSRNIIGAVGAPTLKGAPGILNSLYQRRFQGVPVHVMTSDESEAVKIFINSFFGVKIAYFNEIRTLVDKLGMDWETIMAGLLSDGRVAHSHTQVPGPDGLRGYGGTCIPKDLANFISTMQKHRLRSDVTEGAYNRNLEDRGGEK